jgi:hypothetical protein
MSSKLAAPELNVNGTALPVWGLSVIPVMGNVNDKIELFAGGVSITVRLNVPVVGGGGPLVLSPLHAASANVIRHIRLSKDRIRRIVLPQVQTSAFARPRLLAEDGQR